MSPSQIWQVQSAGDGWNQVVSGDGDNRLVVADLGTGDFNMKLRVYKGTQQVTENTIIDLPTGVVTFHMDTTEPRIPAIAVASAAHIYIYKNLRPYFKFTLPTLEIQPVEKELWDQASTDKMEVQFCVKHNPLICTNLYDASYKTSNFCNN